MKEEDIERIPVVSDEIEDIDDDSEDDLTEVVDLEDDSGTSMAELFSEMRKNPPKSKVKSPLKAIKAHCLETCCCGQMKEVKLCMNDGVHSTLCVLWPFRFGKSPFRPKRKEMSEEQKKKAAIRMKKMQEAARLKREENNGN